MVLINIRVILSASLSVVVWLDLGEASNDLRQVTSLFEGLLLGLVSVVHLVYIVVVQLNVTFLHVFFPGRGYLLDS